MHPKKITFLVSLLTVVIIILVYQSMDDRFLENKIRLVDSAGMISETTIGDLAKDPVLVFSPNCVKCKEYIEFVLENEIRAQIPYRWVSLGTYADTKRLLLQIDKEIQWYILQDGESALARILAPIPFIMQLRDNGKKSVLESKSVTF